MDLDAIEAWAAREFDRSAGWLRAEALAAYVKLGASPEEVARGMAEFDVEVAVARMRARAITRSLVVSGLPPQ
jgi:hypothetical protein